MRLDPEHGRELLLDASSTTRREAFKQLSKGADKVLSATDYLHFLTWASQLTKETAELRAPITGDRFIL
jgi:hypothetical protein